MPGIDPALMASLGNNQAYPGSPPSPVNRAPAGPGDQPTDDGEPKAEPVALHDACMELLETVKAAVEMANDLQSQAEMAEEMDPGAEKAIGQAATMLQQVQDLLTQAEEPLGGAREQHEADMGGDADTDGDMPPG